MNSSVTRRGFLVAGAAGTAGLWTQQHSPARGANVSEDAAPAGITLPHTDPALTKEIVLVSHFSEKRVRELLKDDRSLALASWDWGFGDWETALGAASHMGRRDIAEALMDHGARANATRQQLGPGLGRGFLYDVYSNPNCLKDRGGNADACFQNFGSQGGLATL